MQQLITYKIIFTSSEDLYARIFRRVIRQNTNIYENWIIWDILARLFFKSSYTNRSLRIHKKQQNAKQKYAWILPYNYNFSQDTESMTGMIKSIYWKKKLDQISLFLKHRKNYSKTPATTDLINFYLQ
mgnify:CR=1 FL=1